MKSYKKIFVYLSLLFLGGPAGWRLARGPGPDSGPQVSAVHHEDLLHDGVTDIQAAPRRVQLVGS